MVIKVPIESERLYLRTLQASDASQDYLDWLSDPEVNAYLEVRFSPPKSVNQLASLIAEVNESSHTQMLGVFLQQGARHIGNIKLGPIDWNNQVGDIGFLIGDKLSWGKGYAVKSVSMLTRYAFEDLNLAKVTSSCCEGNEGSRRTLLRAGFFEEGRRVSQCFVGGSRQDGLLFGQVNPKLIKQ